ncbi:unnamed protein product [Gordionus sp. m RMFG-2023]
MLATYLIIFLIATLYSCDRGNADPQLLGSQIRMDRYNELRRQRDEVGSEIFCANRCSIQKGGICPLCLNITTLIII